MRFIRLAPPALALLGAVALFPAQGRSFALLGGFLDLGQRDFRIFNNFTDPGANNNQVADPDFPGALGAELAIWKGVAEWGSRAHGTGSTDPLQSDGIGSGQSNFDAFYVGENSWIGGTNGNTISMLAATLSIHAFTEIPISDGWRIRFVDNPDDWCDGPGPANDGSNPYDIQGVACHEFGHALGLDHSADPDSTMFGSNPTHAEHLRSIEDDDRAGVQFLYGALSPNKPRVDTYELSQGQVTLHGDNFDLADNEVWFSQAVAGGDGTPVKVLFAPSHNAGTRLTVTIPAGAGPGDIAVKRPGDSAEELSNAFPFDPTREPVYQAPVYYGTGTILSTGTVPELTLLNVPSLSAGSLNIQMTGGSFSGIGIVFSGPFRTAVPFPGGTLLVKGPHTRDLVFQFNLTLANLQVPVPPNAVVGESRYYQVWVADPNLPSGAASSRALRVTWSH
ncbi:MAG: hypothetical protein ACI8QC_001763 [Planctomycetota bacterium]|jgi:hypothetical protein